MKAGQKGYIEYDEFSLLRSSPPVNFIIDMEADMWASADFKIVGLSDIAFEVSYIKA